MTVNTPPAVIPSELWHKNDMSQRRRTIGITYELSYFSVSPGLLHVQKVLERWISFGKGPLNSVAVQLETVTPQDSNHGSLGRENGQYSGAVCQLAVTMPFWLPQMRELVLQPGMALTTVVP
jgi:hypothetical protein